MKNAKRWAWAAVSTALLGTTGRADDPGIAPPASDVTTVPVIVIPAPGVAPAAEPSPVPPLPPEPDVTPAADVKSVDVKVVDPATALVMPPVALPPAPPCATCPWPGGWYAGAGLLFVQPYVSNNTAFTVINPPTIPAPGTIPVAIGSAQNQPINWNVGEAFQVWVGWTHASGWGVRADFFNFDQSSDVSTLVSGPNPAGPRIVNAPGVIPIIAGAATFGGPTAVLAGAGIGSDRLVVSSDLTVRSSDLELTYQRAGDDFLVRLSVGGRWQSIKQGYHAALANPGDGVTTEMQALSFEQEFSGAGPTVGLFVRHGIGGTGLAAYGGVRGAILAGHVDQHGVFAQDIADPTLAAFAGTQAIRTRFDNRADHVLTFSELELGLEYGLEVGHSRLFLRGGVVGQSYGNAFNATGTTGTLSLLGGQAAVGLNY